MYFTIRTYMLVFGLSLTPSRLRPKPLYKWKRDRLASFIIIICSISIIYCLRKAHTKV